jgi:DNA (cytosine-5)-methyltransferase 1
MNHGSLFSGGGGFDLAAEAMGWRNVFHCENDAFCQTILKHYWPEADSHHDIKEFNAETYKGKIDILTGGFPCQPFSHTGKRRGTADDRYLWPQMHRIIKAVSPRWIVAENVFGLVNWNDGLVFGTVKSDMEAEGYEVAPFILPATGVNAPHQRYRVWFVGRKRERAARQARRGKGRLPLYPAELEKACPNPHSDGRNPSHCEHEKFAGQTGEHAQRHTVPMGDVAPHAPSQRLERRKTFKLIQPDHKDCLGNWNRWPTQSPICGRDDGLPAQLDGIAFPKWRNKSIKLYGNAIVPHVALQIFKAIEAAERMTGIHVQTN